MNEQQIADNLKQNIPQTEHSTSAPIHEPDQTNGQAHEAQTLELDEMTLYKLHDLFNAQYNVRDEETKQRLSYIYEEVSKLSAESDYAFIAAKIRELQRVAGITNSDNRIYRLYQWLKLDRIRRNTEVEMGVLGD